MDHSICGLSLLTKKYVWHIGEALLQQQLEEWKLLYLSAYNGLSFNTFLGNISWVDLINLYLIKFVDINFYS